ncbi:MULTISPECIES: hypothetical protein [unclassified Shimia]|uniref:hypothetical protein n=1 Tax=unclassified Shimia TaxID=2630038 RepID=UPI003102E099
MYGVVLWSDPKRRKAVIWCEDHQDLAYYDGIEEVLVGRKPDESAEVAVFEAGDMLLFDVSDNGERRVALNPKRVVVAAAEELVRRLKAEGEGATNLSKSRDRQHGNVVRFPDRKEWGETRPLAPG